MTKHKPRAKHHLPRAIIISVLFAAFITMVAVVFPGVSASVTTSAAASLQAEPKTIIDKNNPDLSEPMRIVPGHVFKPYYKLEPAISGQFDPWMAEKKLVRKLKNNNYKIATDRTRFASINFNVGSFNVLGHGHTVKNGNKKGYLNSSIRLNQAVGSFRQHNLSIIGLQEFQTAQASLFNRIAPEYSVFPGNAGGYRVQNSIAWKTNTWELVEAHYIKIPYFFGKPFEMPYVLLKHRTSGEKLWVANFHNPADARGPAQHLRNEARKRQIALANRLQSKNDPVVFTGDFNERTTYVCPFSQATGFMSAENTGWVNGACVSGAYANRVDWVLYKNLTANNYVLDESVKTRKVSDHPLVKSGFVMEPKLALDTCQTIEIKGKSKKLCLPYTKATAGER